MFGNRSPQASFDQVLKNRHWSGTATSSHKPNQTPRSHACFGRHSASMKTQHEINITKYSYRNMLLYLLCKGNI